MQPLERQRAAVETLRWRRRGHWRGEKRRWERLKHCRAADSFYIVPLGRNGGKVSVAALLYVTLIRWWRCQEPGAAPPHGGCVAVGVLCASLHPVIHFCNQTTFQQQSNVSGLLGPKWQLHHIHFTYQFTIQFLLLIILQVKNVLVYNENVWNNNNKKNSNQN